MNSRTINRFLLASSMAFGIASLAHAQPAPQGEGIHRAAMERHHGGGHGFGLRGLNLSEQQRDQIFRIHHDQAPAFRDQVKKLRAARVELDKLARADRYDEAQVRRAADAQAKATSDLAVMRAQTTSRVRAVLTPEQRAQLDKQREERRSHGPRQRG